MELHHAPGTQQESGTGFPDGWVTSILPIAIAIAGAFGSRRLSVMPTQSLPRAKAGVGIRAFPATDPMHGCQGRARRERQVPVGRSHERLI